MKGDRMNSTRRPSMAAGQAGFTLIELMLAVAISIIVLGAVYATYSIQQRTYTNQRMIAEVQQNVRGALLVLQRHIRLAGGGTGGNGITSVQRLDLDGNPDANGFPSITLSGDFDLDGAADTAVFRIYDQDNDGQTDLGLNFNGGGNQLLAEGIQAIGFAFAVDDNLDRVIDTVDGTAGGNPLWLVDDDNDNSLDANLDTNDNGVVDVGDDATGDLWIRGNDSAPLNPQVGLDRIRMVRIWVLGVSARQNRKGVLDTRGANGTANWIVGQRLLPPPNDQFIRRLMITDAFCRNLL